jgi:hypothetical protein
MGNTAMSSFYMLHVVVKLFKAVHIVHHVLLIIFEIFQTAHTMYVASKLVHVCTFLYILLINIT